MHSLYHQLTKLTIINRFRNKKWTIAANSRAFVDEALVFNDATLLAVALAEVDAAVAAALDDDDVDTVRCDVAPPDRAIRSRRPVINDICFFL